MFTIEKLRELAHEGANGFNAEWHRFIDFIERKHAGPVKTVGELQAEAAAAAGPSEAPAPEAPAEEPAAPAAPPAPEATPEPTAPPVEQPAA